VRQRLKLAKVASQLFEMFRDAEINLNQMMALAVTDDHSAGGRFLRPYDCLQCYKQRINGYERTSRSRPAKENRSLCCRFPRREDSFGGPAIVRLESSTRTVTKTRLCRLDRYQKSLRSFATSPR
jgi:hypothetical protein